MSDYRGLSDYGVPLTIDSLYYVTVPHSNGRIRENASLHGCRITEVSLYVSLDWCILQD